MRRELGLMVLAAIGGALMGWALDLHDGRYVAFVGGLVLFVGAFHAAIEARR